MKSFTYEIKDSAGIHARPAGLLVKEADKFSSDIQIQNESGKTADAKRLFAIMGLGIKCGDTITVTVDGSDDHGVGPCACARIRTKQHDVDPLVRQLLYRRHLISDIRGLYLHLHALHCGKARRKQHEYHDKYH